MAAIVALAPILLPLIPSFVEMIQKIIDAVRNHPATDAATKAQLDDLAAHLDATNAKVQAVLLRDV